MSAFDRYYKKEKLISRKLNIEEEIDNFLKTLDKIEENMKSKTLV